jgi:hypothetical protein
MGKFAETTILDYRLSFPAPRKTNFRFPLPFAENRRKFAISIFRFSKQTDVDAFG